MKLSRLLLETVMRISTSCSKDETRVHLMGVHIFTRDSKVYIEACDGYIMTREILHSSDDVASIGDHDLILDAKELKKLKPFLKEWKGTPEYDCELTDHSLLIKAGSSVVSVYRISGEFPRVDSVIPDTNKIPNTVTFTINPDLLVRLLDSLTDEKRKVDLTLTVNLDNLAGPVSVTIGNHDQVAVVMPMRDELNCLKVNHKTVASLTPSKRKNKTA